MSHDGCGTLDLVDVCWEVEELSRKRVRAAVLLVVTVVLASSGCAEPASPSSNHTPAAPAQPNTVRTSTPAPPPEGLQPRLATDLGRLADQLVADEHALREPSSSEAVRMTAARRQQAAYRALGRHPEWDAVTRPRIPPPLLAAYDHNVDARRQLSAMSGRRGKPTVPAWRIVAPPPTTQLLGYYRQAEAATGVGWNYLAAINFVETAFGRIAGVSTAGAQGPMQFLPSTFATYGRGGDILSPRDSIMAAGRFLAAHGFIENPGRALYRYNNSTRYVRAITAYAAVIATQPGALESYHRWDVYYGTTAGDVVLPVGYSATAPVPVEVFLQTNPQ
ncbi:MAG: lytic transglycosylase domain-containing protein [Mycobacterium sp.]